MTDRLKIGQEVLIHGYVDEIRKDTVIIRNEGGYFGTVECEVTDIEMPNTNDVLDKIRAEIEDLDRYFNNDYFSGDNEPMYKCNEVLQIIDKYKARPDFIALCADESSSEKPNKWIPVSERLPEAWRYVNCTCHSLVDDREDWVIETAYLPQPVGSPYSDWGNIVMLNDGDCEVVAWMYRDIPEPYKASPTEAEGSEE